jgi:hypothetical protein
MSSATVSRDSTTSPLEFLADVSEEGDFSSLAPLSLAVDCQAARLPIKGIKSRRSSASSMVGAAKRSLRGFQRSLGDAKSSLRGFQSSLGDAKSSLGDVKSSLGDAKSSLGDATSSLGGAKSSLGDAESSLGDAKSSLGDD